MLFTLFYFFLALVLLIIVHEFGHFLVARWCGVKVLRFSFGFGKVIASWRDRRGTEFAWSIFPLGGYVKMLDESEGEVAADEKHLAFNNKSVWARMAIVLAGPLFNFLFAFAALWLMLTIGIKSLAPMIDAVQPGSFAARAGFKANQEILALNEEKINSWRDFQYALMPLIGTEEPVTLRVKSLDNGKETELILPLADWQLNTKSQDVLKSMGITPFVPTIPPIVGSVLENSPAQAAGLRVDDKVTHIDGVVVDSWLVLVEYVRKNPNKQTHLTIERNGASHTIPVKIGQANNNGAVEGLLGVRSNPVNWPSHWLRLHQENPLQAAGTAFLQTLNLTKATFTLMGRLALGKLPWQSLSGPVGIAQGAGESARSGLAYYLSFLALVSISLGVLNLLPIPMLDGGHLLYCLLEIIRRRPLSEEVRSLGMYLGLLILIALMVVALTNDISRLVG
ncbi:RIP metalloprotease RseP [Legionella sp. 27cVA30]|uniref:RIP metalloprotease RseP n=1 Tax=Legionella sp. 27cVA30 TaxID=2905657 RepID=UPI0020A080EE|nr:RIP metalloprotease RseP [Legionella sp. 27cVA30]MCP0913175.1 RIP metalloprotease RseP [Legionella sp. 27cVA30]